MSDPIDIRSRKPHLEGTARCMACMHEWEAVAETGSIDLTCPECSCHRGVWIGPITTDVEMWQCNHCKNAVFYVHKHGIRCLGCGFLHKLKVTPE